MIRDAVKVVGQQRRSYSTSAGDSSSHKGKASSGQEAGGTAGQDRGQRSEGEVGSGPEEAGPNQLSQRQKLQRAVAEYGSTVIVFHVTISLASLGFFYLLVSR